MAGLQKNALELKKRRRVCPSCGRRIDTRALHDLRLARLASCFGARRLSCCATLAAVRRSSASASSSCAETLEQHDRLALRRAVLQAEDREPAHGGVAVRRRHRVQQRADAVDRARMVARQELEREQRRAARGRALVVEPAPQQLLLRAPAELADRAERDGALAEVGAPRGRLELVAPLRAQIGELALRARPARGRLPAPPRLRARSLLRL